MSHASREHDAPDAPKPIAGFTIHDESDVLQPEPARQGGLTQKDLVCTVLLSFTYL